MRNFTYATRWYRRTWVVRAALLALLLGAPPTSCTTAIIPPTDPVDPVSVYLIDHGRTSSLVLPASKGGDGGDGGMVRYAYGDWEYYALAHNDLWHGIAALLWPTQAALGRGILHGPASRESVRAQVQWIDDIYEIPVSRSAAQAFLQRMNDLYQSRIDTEVENRPYGMNFVHHPRRYTYFWNSNHAVASWVRELGCRTRGLSFHSNWRVDPPE